jgi:glutamate-ammonia-ligase adenylyltransferase
VVLVKGEETFRFEIDERFASLPRAGLDEDLERRLAELRRYKNEEVLRIAVHDIAGAIPLSSVADQLSDLAEASLERCLALAEEEARAKDRLPPARLCVVGMGKLGGRELGYHSDLDLVFLYREGSEGPRPEYARLAQRLMSFLQLPLREGILYKIDTRLRPSGNQGALVTSVAGFARYHGVGGGSAHVRSQLWERQALLRARFVAGDESIFDEVRERVIVPTVYERADPAGRAALAAEIRRMRERIEAELGREQARGKNPKTGRGGLVDVEFAAQFLQLAHGDEHPSIRTPTTPLALRRLREAGLLRDAPFRALARGYEFLRRLELRLRIVHDYTVDHLPPPSAALAQLARRSGYFGEDPGARLLADYARVTADVRAAFDEVVS